MPRSGLYNLVTVLSFIAVLALLTVAIAALVSPPPPPEFTPIPTFVGELPTVTPTHTPTATATPTATVPPTFTPRPSATPTITPSPSPTALPTSTPIRPSETPSDTPTPSITPTPTETPIPFPFIAQGEPVLSANTANALGCRWRGVGGQVLGAAGELSAEQAAELRVRIFSDVQDNTVRLGSNFLYGSTTGWEQSLPAAGRDQPLLVYVRLEAPNGTPRSPDVLVRFPGDDCNASLARVTFVINPRYTP